MKSLSIALGSTCAVLVLVLFLIKHSDNAQIESDAGSINDFSNQLVSAQAQLARRDGTILVISNSLADSVSAALTFSNQLIEAQSTVAHHADQITNLTRQVTTTESEKQALDQRVMNLTNQVSGLTRQTAALRMQTNALAGEIALAKTNLSQASKDYQLLENRFRIDVAERVVVERKFNVPSELRAQIKNLKNHPAEMISAEKIYAGLDVEVKTNSVHVISPN